jgi:hypothetical protein
VALVLPAASFPPPRPRDLATIQEQPH